MKSIIRKDDKVIVHDEYLRDMNGNRVEMENAVPGVQYDHLTENVEYPADKYKE